MPHPALLPIGSEATGVPELPPVPLLAAPLEAPLSAPLLDPVDATPEALEPEAAAPLEVSPEVAPEPLVSPADAPLPVAPELPDVEPAPAPVVPLVVEPERLTPEEPVVAVTVPDAAPLLDTLPVEDPVVVSPPLPAPGVVAAEQAPTTRASAKGTAAMPCRVKERDPLFIAWAPIIGNRDSLFVPRTTRFASRCVRVQSSFQVASRYNSAKARAHCGLPVN
jgi:hypothetical protein